MSSSLPLSDFPNLSLESERLPRHIAIVMDGNGRWATRRGLARFEGHRRGKDSVRAIVETAREIGIPYLTLFAFSSENWQRPTDEVRFLMELLRRYLMTETKRMMKRGIRLVTIGDLSRLPLAVQRALLKVIDLTKNNCEMTVALGLSYGGRQDVVRAMQRLAGEVASGRLRPEQIDESKVSRSLDTWGLPDPDLLIRTSGEMRLSNFILYQAAYTELYFADTLWPDFRARELLAAIEAYQRRERRFGTLPDTGHTDPRLRAAN